MIRFGSLVGHNIADTKINFTPFFFFLFYERTAEYSAAY